MVCLACLVLLLASRQEPLDDCCIPHLLSPAACFLPTMADNMTPRKLASPGILLSPAACPLQAMAEAMTPDKSAGPTAERQALLRRIAKVAKHQGQYHLACKKYTQVSLGGASHVLHLHDKPEMAVGQPATLQQASAASLAQPEWTGTRHAVMT